MAQAARYVRCDCEEPRSQHTTIALKYDHIRLEVRDEPMLLARGVFDFVVEPNTPRAATPVR
jgi:hypothetical protein